MIWCIRNAPYSIINNKGKAFKIYTVMFLIRGYGYFLIDTFSYTVYLS